MMGMLLPLCSIFFSTLLCIIYFSKKRVNLIENKMYSAMIISILFDSIITTFLQLLSIDGVNKTDIYLANIFNKIDFVALIIFFSALFCYVSLITLEKIRKKFNLIFMLLVLTNSLILLLILLLKVDVIEFNGNFSVEGSAVYTTYIICFIYMFLSFLIVVLNYKKLDKRHIPIFAVIGFMTIAFVSFKLNPYIIIVSILLTFVNYIMYFTIENPDVKMIEQLNILKDQADKANNAKTEFLSSMSHEIRTPLNAINGFAQLILEEDNIDTIKEETKDIIAASDNLIEIVNGILDISKIEANKLEIVNVEYEPSKVFDELVKLTKARIGEKSLDFRVSIAEDLPDYLNGDYVRLKQIVLNLLTNAVKYTQEGYVDFSVKCIKKDDVCRLFINVKDSGIGIKPENITKLFSKFERFDKEKNMTIEGTGLGLAITKKLIDLMGGNINVSSLYGEGSIFSVVIDQRIVNKVKAKVIEGEVVEKKDYSDKKVLIVDDNLINLKVAGRLLGTYKVNTKEVSSGFDCLKLIEEGEKFDLILMDDMMPKMSGVETFQKLCEKDDFHTPVVALTANAIAGMKEKYLDLGFNDYISKPIDKKELERVLKTYLK